VQAS
jgi:hypothetical protein